MRLFDLNNSIIQKPFEIREKERDRKNTQARKTRQILQSAKTQMKYMYKIEDDDDDDDDDESPFCFLSIEQCFLFSFRNPTSDETKKSTRFRRGFDRKTWPMCNEFGCEETEIDSSLFLFVSFFY